MASTQRARGGAWKLELSKTSRAPGVARSAEARWVRAVVPGPTISVSSLPPLLRSTSPFETTGRGPSLLGSSFSHPKSPKSGEASSCSANPWAILLEHGAIRRGRRPGAWGDQGRATFLKEEKWRSARVVRRAAGRGGRDSRCAASPCEGHN